MAEVTLDQQRALALASARARANQAQNASGAADSGSGAAPITVNDAVNATARGVPVIGSGLDELDAATNATISPLIPSWLADAIPGDSWKQRYLSSLATIRGNDRAFDSAHPLGSLGLRLLGGAAAGGGAMLAAPNVTRTALGMLPNPVWLPWKILTGAFSGGLLGGLHGFGEGQGGFDSRLSDAANSAKWGAGTGAAIPPIAHAEGREIADYLRSEATADQAENAAGTVLGAGTVSIFPPQATLLQHLLGLLGGANPAISGRRREDSDSRD